jgi:hypothetical protein
MMSARRFEAIFSAWHWLDTTGFSAAERHEKSWVAPFWQVAGFLSLLASNCMKYYVMGYLCYIGEMCIAFLGRVTTASA